jgi:hypothetical protein
MPTTHHSAWLVNDGLNSLRGNQMKATQLLHNLGQSLWLDNITRDLINSGTLKRYIDELSVTGLTSNPTIFDHAKLQDDGAKSFVGSWNDLMEVIASKSATLTKAG